MRDVVACPDWFASRKLRGLAALGRARRPWTSIRLSLFCLLWVTATLAGPRAQLLRISPETTMRDGSPVVTAVIDVSETTRMSQLKASCAGRKGSDQLDCLSNAFEAPHAFARPVTIPEESMQLTVEIDGADHSTRAIEQASFGERLGEPGVGTAYLIVLDADSHGKETFDEARAVAEQFVESMGPGDWVNLMVLSPRTIAADTDWQPLASRDVVLKVLEETDETFSSRDRTRPLLDLFAQATRSAFGQFSVDDQGAPPPLHQAVVFLSSGYGGGDPSTTGPGASELRARLSLGRLDPDNSALPKMPLPIISLFFEPSGMAEHKQLARAFMENLSNPEIGGFYSILRDGREAPVRRIVDAVRARFADLTVARFSLSCVAPSATQSFKLLFPNTNIAGDASFSDVPVGITPHEWPLNVDAELTTSKVSEGNRVFPGSTLRIFGDFCWGTDIERPEIYFIPPGESLPDEIKTETEAAELRKRLVSLDVRGRALAANNSFAEFEVPDTTQILHGEGERQVVRVVVVDTLLQRSSGIARPTVLTLAARDKPLPILWIVGGSGGALILLLLLGILLRVSTRRSATSEPRHHVVVERSPYATPAPVSRPSSPPVKEAMRAVLEGQGLRFVLLPGSDLRVGRDGSRCAAVLSCPQVSGLHATFRLQAGQALVRDEGSTAGTRIDGRLIRPDIWEPVVSGATVALGSEELQLRLEQDPS